MTLNRLQLIQLFYQFIYFRVGSFIFGNCFTQLTKFLRVFNSQFYIPVFNQIAVQIRSGKVTLCFLIAGHIFVIHARVHHKSNTLLPKTGAGIEAKTRTRYMDKFQ